MKIFSWVHRFRRKSYADDDNEKVALLENQACDGWKQGILAIGTLGTDLFNDFYLKEDEEKVLIMMNNQELCFGSEDEQDDDDDDQEGEMDQCPLVLRASKHGFGHVQKQDPSPKPNYSGIQDDVCVKDSIVFDTQEDTKKTKIRKNGSERITLADLLWADSEKNVSKNNNKLSDDHFKNPNNGSTTGTKFIKTFLISKKKKKKLDKDESTHPIKKTKQLMRKMLKKKKIHPENGILKKESASQEMEVHAT